MHIARFALALVAALLCGPSLAQQTAAEDTAAPPVRPVKLMVLQPGEGVIRRQFFGTVVARQTVNLAFQVAGQLRRFPVLEGTTLDAGDLIAELDLEPFERRLDQARLQSEQADRDLRRLQQLSSASVSQAALDNAKSASDLAALAVRDAEYSLRQATLRAPFDGLVASRDVANFTSVQVGTPVIRLHDISEWRVEIDVPEVLFRSAGENPDIDLYGTFTGSDRQIPLVPREFRAEASSVGQSFLITLAMEEAPGPGVLPGTSITVVALLPAADSDIEIPASAVVMDPDGAPHIMVFEPSADDVGTVRRTPAALETGPGGSFFLTDEIAPGTEVVVAGAQMLKDGQTVRRFTGFAQ